MATFHMSKRCIATGDNRSLSLSKHFASHRTSDCWCATWGRIYL